MGRRKSLRNLRIIACNSNAAFHRGSTAIRGGSWLIDSGGRICALQHSGTKARPPEVDPRIGGRAGRRGPCQKRADPKGNAGNRGSFLNIPYLEMRSAASGTRRPRQYVRSDPRIGCPTNLDSEPCRQQPAARLASIIASNWREGHSRQRQRWITSSPTWEERSVYRGDQWMISRIKCLPGDYVPKERV